MNYYEIWWKVKSSGQILNTTLTASSREDAKSKVLAKYGYKNWEIRFSKAEICS